MAETAPLSQATGPVGEESAAQAVKKVPDYPPAGPAAENQNIFQPETVKAPKKKNSARTIVTAVEAFLLIAVCFLCYRQIEKINNPETVIHTYMDEMCIRDRQYLWRLLRKTYRALWRKFKQHAGRQGKGDVSGWRQQFCDRLAQRDGRQQRVCL